jgi:DNA-directed RNA polymerase sigma subunit (sigma70/sigma32)
MQKTSFTTLAVALGILLAGGPVRAADTAAAKDTLNQRLHEVDDMAKERNMTDPMLKHISVETGVPQDQVQAMHKRHPKVGVAGVFMACVLADETKKPPEDFMKAHDNGKSVAAMAEDNHVKIQTLIARLDRLEHTFSSSTTERAREKERHKK